VTAKATDGVAGFHKAWDKRPSDKARGAGDGDGSGSVARCLRIRHPGGTALTGWIVCSGGISRSEVSVGNSIICRVTAPRTLIPRKPNSLTQSGTPELDPSGSEWIGSQTRRAILFPPRSRIPPTMPPARMVLHPTHRGPSPHRRGPTLPEVSPGSLRSRP
jgi:hypothetical protein